MKETRRGNEITLSASLRDHKDFEELIGRAAELLSEAPAGRAPGDLLKPEIANLRKNAN